MRHEITYDTTALTTPHGVDVKFAGSIYKFVGTRKYGQCWLVAGCQLINAISAQDGLVVTLKSRNAPHLASVMEKAEKLLRQINANRQRPGAAPGRSIEDIVKDTSPDRKVTPNILAHIEFQWALHDLHERVGDLNVNFDYGQLKTALDQPSGKLLAAFDM